MAPPLNSTVKVPSSGEVVTSDTLMSAERKSLPMFCCSCVFSIARTNSLGTSVVAVRVSATDLPLASTLMESISTVEAGWPVVSSPFTTSVEGVVTVMWGMVPLNMPSVSGEAPKETSVPSGAWSRIWLPM